MNEHSCKMSTDVRFQTLAAEVDSRSLQLSSNLCADNVHNDKATIVNSFNVSTPFVVF